MPCQRKSTALDPINTELGQLYCGFGCEWMNSDCSENLGLKLHYRHFNLGEKAKVLGSLFLRGKGRVKDGCTFGSRHAWIPHGDS